VVDAERQGTESEVMMAIRDEISVSVVSVSLHPLLIVFCRYIPWFCGAQ
jgi:hypothetical protein